MLAHSVAHNNDSVGPSVKGSLKELQGSMDSRAGAEMPEVDERSRPQITDLDDQASPPQPSKDECRERREEVWRRTVNNGRARAAETREECRDAVAHPV